MESNGWASTIAVDADLCVRPVRVHAIGIKLRTT
jgi:hypothetical protein